MLDEIVGPGRAGIERAPRHGEDFAPLFAGEAGGDQRARPLGSFHHDNAERDPRDQTIAAREVLSPRRKAGVALANEKPLFTDGVRRALLRRRQID